MTSTCGRYEGFTLVEVVVALSIIAISFTVLIDTITSLGRETGRAEERFLKLVTLDRKVKEGDHEGVEITRTEVPDFPKAKEVVYSLEEVFLVRYEIR